MPTPTDSALAMPAALTADDTAELQRLALAANQSDAAAKKLHAFCQRHPAAWASFDNLEQEAIDGWLRLLTPDSTRQPHATAWKRERIEEEIRRRRTALRADSDSPLEHLLVNRIIAAWLMTMEADAHYARWMSKGGTFKEGEYQQKRLERAQRQLLRAIHALATVRRLLRPTQVNVINQVNAAQG